MRVTLRDVARLAEASPAAVSATLRGDRGKSIRVSEKTRERIIEAAAKLGYTPNAVAQSLATGKTGVIGIVLPYADAFIDQNPFCSEVMTGILSEVVRSRYNTMLYTASTGLTHDQIAAMVDRRAEGLVLVMPPPDAPILQRAEKLEIPYVTVLRPFSEGGYTVNSDDYRGARLATDHLLSLGHRRIAHFVGHPEVMTSAGRKLGYLDSISESGQVPMLIPAGFDWKDGEQAMQKVLAMPKAEQPTAVLCANDLCAEGAMRALRTAGLRIPDDMALIGFDDTWFASMMQPTLTSVNIPIQQMGILATQMLIDLLEDREPQQSQVCLPVTLSVRESSGEISAPAPGATRHP